MSETAAITNEREKRAQFMALLAPLRESLYRYARHIIRDQSSAEDALQDAILSAFRKFETFQPGTDFRAWIYRFVLNTVLNYNRASRRDLEVPVEPPTLDLFQNLESGFAYDEVLKDPDRFLEQVGDNVRTAFLALRPVEQTVFLLRAIEGFTYREIANLLEIPVGTVMSHLARARAKLRERLAEYAHETGFVRGEA